MKKLLCLIVMLIFVGTVGADIVILDAGNENVTAFNDDGTTQLWQNGRGKKGANLAVSQDGTEVWTCMNSSYPYQWLERHDAVDGTTYGKVFEGDYVKDAEVGHDYNGDGVSDVYLSSRDTLYVLDGTTMKTDEAVRLATWTVPSTSGYNGTGGNLLFGPDMNNDGVGDLFSTNGSNDSTNRINVWDPTNGSQIASYDGSNFRWARDMILGPDQNGDGQEDLWIVDHYRDKIRAFDVDGTYIAPVDLGISIDGPTDIIELPNGDIMISTRGATSLSTNSSVILYDVSEGTSSLWMEVAGGDIEGIAYVVPEPATMVLFGLGSLVMFRRKK